MEGRARGSRVAEDATAQFGWGGEFGRSLVSADTMDLLLNSDQTPGTGEDPMTLLHPEDKR
jgi:hypothetical protein